MGRMKEIDYRWYVALVDRGHTPVLDHNGDLETCVLAHDIHNGPGCSTCGWSACMHCGSIEGVPLCGEVE